MRARRLGSESGLEEVVGRVLVHDVGPDLRKGTVLTAQHLARVRQAGDVHVVELEPGDCLLSYTDALVESRDADGEMLGEEGLLRIMRLLGDVEPQRLIEKLLEEIAGRYPGNLSDDDATALLVRANAVRVRG